MGQLGKKGVWVTGEGAEVMGVGGTRAKAGNWVNARSSARAEFGARWVLLKLEHGAAFTRAAESRRTVNFP